MSEKFRDESNQIIHTHIERLLEVLPDFCAEFFVGTEMRTSWLTRYNYAHDFIIFFDYLLTLRKFAGVNITTFSFEHLDEITSTDIENFLSKVTYRKVGVQTRKNGENGKARKLSAIRSLLKYFYNKDKIAHNVASKVSLPKIHDKEIVRLTQDEAVKLLDTARNGDSEPTSRKQHWEFLRDFAMVTLFLHTGMRISELVGLDVKDINLKEECLSVVRKGGAGTVLYFDDTARDALAEYIEIRKFKVGIEPLIKGDEDALFISSRCRRIGIRTVQEIIKAQAETAAPLKKISPHKLRSTYGTLLYRSTHDIYVVAEVLGHKDVNTTKKHYAAISEDIKKKAAKAVVIEPTDTSSEVLSDLAQNIAEKPFSEDNN